MDVANREPVVDMTETSQKVEHSPQSTTAHHIATDNVSEEGEVGHLNSRIKAFELQDATAAQKVFGIPELLEMILIELLFKDALRMLRGNTSFRNTIALSGKLRRHLLMQQEFDTAADQTTEPRINPVLIDMLEYFTRKYGRGFEITTLEVVEPNSTAYQNYTDREKQVNDMARGQGSKCLAWINIGKYKTANMEEIVKWMRSQKQTWHDLYVTDRPCAVLVAGNNSKAITCSRRTSTWRSFFGG